MTDWTLVGGDPAPGDVAAIKTCAVRLRKSAKDAMVLKGALERIQRNSEELRWHGEGGDAFRARLRDLPGFLGLLCDSHEELAAAFDQYAATLGGLQSWAAQLLQMATKAQSDGAAGRQHLDSANAALRDAATRRDSAHTEVTRAHAQWTSYAQTPGADPAQTAHLHQRWIDVQVVATRADSTLGRAREDVGRWQRSVADSDERLRIARAETEKMRGQSQDARRQLARRVSGASDIRIPDDPLLTVAFHYAVDVLRPSGDTDKFIRFLSGLSQLAQWIGMIPIPGLSLVAGTIATGLAIVILFGRVLQALYGQRSWSAIAGDTLNVALTATSMIPMSKSIEKASLLSQAKRWIWYDDARHAVGGWRTVHAAPKVAQELLKLYPELSPSTLYRVGMVLTWTKDARDVGDNVVKATDLYYDMKGKSWSALPEIVAAHGVDAVYGEGTAANLKAAAQSAAQGDVAGAVAGSFDALAGDGTLEKLSQAGDDLAKGDIVKGIGDLGD